MTRKDLISIHDLSSAEVAALFARAADVKARPREHRAALSGKILEVPVKRLLTGAPPADVASRDSLANPEALDWFSRFAKR